MKKALLLALVALLGLVVAPAYPSGPLGHVDFCNGAANESGVVEGTNVRCTSFRDEGPGSWGGEYGQGMVTYRPGYEEDPAGYCHFQWDVGSNARRLELRVLDSGADDSFEVYAQNRVGKWMRVYRYTDQHTNDTWIVHNVKHLPTGKGKSTEVYIQIVPTNPGPYFDGQLAVDYVTLYGTK